MPRSCRSRSPAKRKPASGAPEPCQVVPGEALPVSRQAAALRSGEGPPHDPLAGRNRETLRVPRLLRGLDPVFGEARLPEPRPRLRPGTPAVGESPRQGRRQRDHVRRAVLVLHTHGMHLHAIGDPSTPAAARRLRPWPSCRCHGRSGRRSPQSSLAGCRSRPPSAPSPCLGASPRAPGTGSAPSSAHRRAFGRGTGAGRSNATGNGAEAPAVGAPWREPAGRRPPLFADPLCEGAPSAPARAASAGSPPIHRRRLRADGRPASCKGDGHRRPRGLAVPFHGCSGANAPVPSRAQFSMTPTFRPGSERSAMPNCRKKDVRIRSREGEHSCRKSAYRNPKATRQICKP